MHAKILLCECDLYDDMFFSSFKRAWEARNVMVPLSFYSLKEKIIDNIAVIILNSSKKNYVFNVNKKSNLESSTGDGNS